VRSVDGLTSRGWATGFLRRLVSGTGWPHRDEASVVIAPDGAEWAAYADHFWSRTVAPAGRYSVLTRDSDDGERGPDARGPGRWALAHGDRVVAEGRLERPSDARVADDGTFVISDSLRTDALAGRFCAFDATGTLLLDERLGANISDTFLTPDGAYAAVACAANPDALDFHERLTVYDLPARRRLWDVPLVDGRPTAVTFDLAAGAVRVAGVRPVPIDYRLADGAVDDAAPETETLRVNDGFRILRSVERALAVDGPLDPGRAAELVAACDLADARLAAYPAHRANAQRAAGEALLRAGDEDGALARWQAALALDAKVGVRRRADVLAEKLAQ